MEFLNLFKNDFSHLNYNANNFFLIAGPCVVESKEVLRSCADTLVPLCKSLEIPFVFKSSYRKANRSSSGSFTGIGDIAALNLLAEIRADYNVPVISDIHSAADAELAAQYVDALQIPAFLCRQSDILEAAAKTGKYINIKKGQFLSPEVMNLPAKKVQESGNNKVALCDRGTCFGYQDLVVDFRAIPIMKNFELPVIMDCTHALQQPNQTKGITGGQPQFIETIAKCAIAAGADGLFIETHPHPDEAKSDGANMLALDQMEKLLKKLIPIRRAIL